jgi:hypothetical protein
MRLAVPARRAENGFEYWFLRHAPDAIMIRRFAAHEHGVELNINRIKEGLAGAARAWDNF